MKKTYTFLLSFFLVTAIASLSCTPGFVPRPDLLGCIQGCNHPDFANCDQLLFPAIYDPSFCGLKSDGTWQSFTFACQACQIPEFIGVKEGICTCEELGCHAGQTCQNGFCEGSDPCFPEVTSPVGCILSCQDPKFDSCPPFYPQIYNPSFCAWTSSGQWVNYTFQCQGCINQNSIGIMDGACSCQQLGCDEGFTCINRKCQRENQYCRANSDCQQNQICVDGICHERPLCSFNSQCKQGYFCHKGNCVDSCLFIEIACQDGYECREGGCKPIENSCTNNFDCKPYEFCLNGVCTDKCAYIKCAGPCFQGECQPQCSSDADCVFGWECQQGGCIDKCARVTCPIGKKCRNGECQDPPCRFDSQCSSGHTCIEGNCIDRCATIRCKAGYDCINGQCVKRECENNEDCPPFQICNVNKCIDACALILCSPGLICKNGQCISPCNFDSDCKQNEECLQGGCIDKCARVTCPYGHKCINGDCIKGCTNDQDCPQYHICNVDYCIDACHVIDCYPGLVCKNGQCITPGCLSDLDCQPNEECLQGGCIDKCARVTCKFGHECINGQCVAKACQSNDDCPQFQICNVDVCVDICVLVRCSAGLICEKGQCIEPTCQVDSDCPFQPSICEGRVCQLLPKCSSNNDCKEHESCIDGYCKDLCRGVVCDQGLPCLAGQCPIIQPPECREDYDCVLPEVCQHGFCVDLCEGITCSPGYSCDVGQCIPDTQGCYSDADCPNSLKCIENACINTCNSDNCRYGECVQGACTCVSDKYCSDTELCIHGSCREVCQGVKCPSLSSCKKGVCRPEIQVCEVDEENEENQAKEIQAITCVAPRPTKEECPVIVYIRQPDPLVCGVKKNGHRVSFPRTCEACQRQDIVYYFNAPCSEVPLNYCNLGEKCVDNVCKKEDECFPEVTSPVGCIQSCDDEIFDDCPDFFVQVFQPNFCAWTKEHKWQNFTYDCEACNDDNVLGVLAGPCTCQNIACPGQQECFDGKCYPKPACNYDSDCPEGSICNGGGCVDLCFLRSCPRGQDCRNGQCIPTSCQDNSNCEEGFVCQQNICVPEVIIVQPDLDICPWNTQHKAVTCIEPRPTDIQCPVIYYFRAPDPVVCGVTPAGQRIDFPRTCDACKDSKIVYYFDVPCAFAPLVCEDQEKCKGHQCVSGCTAHSDCPFNWQMCNSFTNECVDRCTFLKCANCIYGKCGYQQPSEKCKLFDNECSNPNDSCVSGLCIDKCIKTRCPVGLTCQKGICKPDE